MYLPIYRMLEAMCRSFIFIDKNYIILFHWYKNLSTTLQFRVICFL